jgi:surfeit locus 1 family protein
MMGAMTSREPIRITIAGVAGTVLALVVVLVCVRLGLWQLDRLAERRALNAVVAERIAEPPLPLASARADTAGLVYRRLRVEGRWDAARTVVWAARSRGGMPGVHVLTPLVLADGGAVLVDRGWVPAPDAATVELAALRPPAPVPVVGLALPFHPERSDVGRAVPAAPPIDPGTGAGYRLRWVRLEHEGLAGQLPYPLARLYVQELPGQETAGYPRPIPTPALGEGNHRSYAFQWFSFAAIALVGWGVLMVRSSGGERRPVRRAPPAPPLPPAAPPRGRQALLLALAVAGGGAALLPTAAVAQLRPTEPLEWRALTGAAPVVVRVGGGVYRGQRASLAGMVGRLTELGEFTAAWRTGRIVLEAGGTGYRLFRDDELWAAGPAFGAESAADGRRRDVGDFRLATTVRLTPEAMARPASPGAASVAAVLRFGTRLPTTDNVVGLERDQTDFFALVGGRAARRGASLAGEIGLGIHGTPHDGFEQVDVLLHAVAGTWRWRALEASVAWVGQRHGLRGWEIRGTENLGEVRLGLEAGRRRFVRAELVRGHARFSPKLGLRVSAGAALGG